MSKMLKENSLVLAVFVLPVIVFWLWTYFSLTNPFEEMYYSEVEEIRVMPFKELSDVIKSEAKFVKGKDDFKTLAYHRDLSQNEVLHVFVSDAHQLTFWYNQDIKESTGIGIRYKYNFKTKELKESIYFTTNGGESNEKSYKGQEMLAKLKEYGKDKDWLKKQADAVLNDKILGLWFKEGSSRYSLKHLGDVKIIRDKVLE